MNVMTAAPPLPVTTDAGAIPLGAAAALIEDMDGGRVFLHGNLVYAWAPGEDALRRWSAVQLVRLGAAPVAQVAAGFGVDPGTLWRWGQALSEHGIGALASDKRGPKGPHRLTAPVIARIQALRADGATLAAIAQRVGLGVTSVRRALARPDPDTTTTTTSQGPAPHGPDPAAAAPPGGDDQPGAGEPARAKDPEPARAKDPGPAGADPDAARAAAPAVLPVLPPAVDRGAERVLARFGLLGHARPVFAPAARVPLAGLLLALPALEASGLLGCARTVFTALPNGFYGLDTTLLEAVLRTLTGQARAEGATRIDPVAFGRVLGLDRAPQVKTIRRKLALLAGTGKAPALIAALAATHLARPQAAAASSSDPVGTAALVGLVLYVDGHVRAYQGGRKVAKTHLARLRFPAPATLETWVCDAHGDPVLVVLAEPGASLASELRRLVPELRAAVGDERRVLVGFDRGDASPALFAHLHERGFDVLTWRKGPTPDIDPAAFRDLTFIDETGRQHTWRAADTTTDLALSTSTKPGDGQVFTMRQVTLAVPATKHQRKHAGSGGTDKGVRQIHILTTRTDLPTEELIHRMGSRWRQENYFRYARMHFELDSHDSYAATDDDPHRPVPNPAKKHAHQAVLAARARHQQAIAATDAALLAAKCPTPGASSLLFTNAEHNTITADLHQAQAAVDKAQAAHADIPARLPLGQVNPGQQVLDTQTKLLTHAIRMAAFNTASTLARELRLHTSYARKHEAHTLIRQALTSSGDIDTSTDQVLTIRLDPLPTRRATTAIAQLCAHLTATQTRYPGTNLILRYEIKTEL